MNALFNGLDDKEKKTLGRLTAAVLCALALGIVVTARQRSNYLEARDSLTALQANYRKAQKARADAKTEWLRWQEARRDMDSFKGTLFYGEPDVFQAVRLDLRTIFNRAGLDVPLINYRYADMEKTPIKKIIISFDYTGTYAEFRKFLGIVEGFRKFLAVEKVDFQKADAESGVLHLKLTLAGYYEI